MKKYLMTGIAALTLGGLFTSCSHDMSVYQGDVAQQVKDNYEQAFIQTFGQPAPTQDWGFGSSSVAGVRGGTRAVPGITFPTFKDGKCPDMPTKYKNTLTEAIADGAKYAKDYQNYQNGDIIYINTDYQQLNNPQNYSDLTIYVDGNVTYNGQTNQNGNGTVFCVTENSTLKLGQVSERLTVYLAPNATLDVTQALNWDGTPATDWQGNPSPLTFTKENAALYMSEGSKVKGTNIYFKDSYTVLNEGGTIETGDLHVENGAILYNKNKVKATGVIALWNTDGEIDNFGTMEGASMTLDANARFYNVAGGEVTISGLTKINNNSGNNAWMNGGQFNTGSFEITGGCSDPVAFNNCHMSVTGKFFMNHGNFVLDGGAAVECGSFEWQSDNYFHMGGKALLKVTGELLANNQNTGYGFYGDATDYAVIQAGSIKKGSEGKFRAAYFGHLFIDTDNHFTQGENSADGTWYTFDDNVKFSFTDNTNVSGYQTQGAKTAQKAENFSINIPADNAKGCTPGYTWGTSNEESCIVIAEDLSAKEHSDFDFNDAVFKVTKKGGKVSVTILAAGGELPIFIGNVNNDNELHARFAKANEGRGITTKTMINTIEGDRSYTTPTYELAEGEWDKTKTAINEIAASIKVTVYKSSEYVELLAPVGQAAAKLAVGTDYEWCDEWQGIDKKYDGKFTKYVGDETGTILWNKWYK